MTVDPENIKALLSTQFNEFGKGSRLNRGWKQVFMGGRFSLNLVSWRWDFYSRWSSLVGISSVATSPVPKATYIRSAYV